VRAGPDGKWHALIVGPDGKLHALVARRDERWLAPFARRGARWRAPFAKRDGSWPTLSANSLFQRVAIEAALVGLAKSENRLTGMKTGSMRCSQSTAPRF